MKIKIFPMYYAVMSSVVSDFIISATHELVFINFYADWCRFSQILKPVFEEAAKKVKEIYPVSKQSKLSVIYRN